MSKKILTFLIVSITLSFCFVNLLAINPFLRRVDNTVNTRTYDSPPSTIVTQNSYKYSASEPALIDSITVTATTTNGEGTNIVVTRYMFDHQYLVSDNETKVIYHQYPIPSNGYIGYYMYLFDVHGNTKEVIVKSPSPADSLHMYYHYLTENRPDSMYIKTVSGGSTSISSYKMQYDELNRLVSSIQQVQSGNVWYNIRKAVLNYGPTPIQYPNPLDFDNFRFYTMINSGFENSNPLFDKYYAPISIEFLNWYSSSGNWGTNPNYFYDVEVNGNEIALINNDIGNYDGHFYFDETGRYTGKYVDDYSNDSNVIYHINYVGDVQNDDDTASPVNQILSTYPNPFSNNLKISISSKKPIDTDISIYNIKGQLIRSWKNTKASELNWDGKDISNKPVSSGVYLIKAKQGNSVSCRKIIKL